jgi:hypothetical protein
MRGIRCLQLNLPNGAFRSSYNEEENRTGPLLNDVMRFFPIESFPLDTSSMFFKNCPHDCEEHYERDIQFAREIYNERILQ